MGREDDEAWRSIVDNYGERARLDPHEPATDAPADPGDDAPGLDEAGDGSGRDDVLGSRRDRDRGVFAPRWDDPLDGSTEDAPGDADRFVPPTPPPMPRPSRDRFAAWAGVFGAPLVLLVFVVLGVRPPELLSYLLVGAFVGGFLYLVVRMSREPRDPWDDGAQL